MNRHNELVSIHAIITSHVMSIGHDADRLEDIGFPDLADDLRLAASSLDDVALSVEARAENIKEESAPLPSN